MEMVEYVRRTGRSLPGIPAAKAKAAENPAAAEKTLPANGSANSRSLLQGRINVPAKLLFRVR